MKRKNILYLFLLIFLFSGAFQIFAGSDLSYEEYNDTTFYDDIIPLHNIKKSHLKFIPPLQDTYKEEKLELYHVLLIHNNLIQLDKIVSSKSALTYFVYKIEEHFLINRQKYPLINYFEELGKIYNLPMLKEATENYIASNEQKITFLGLLIAFFGAILLIINYLFKIKKIIKDILCVIERNMEIGKTNFAIYITFIIILIVGILNYNKNPPMLQAIATIALVLITFAYAKTLSEESHKQIKRKKKKIRKMFFGEIKMNYQNLTKTNEWIEDKLKNLKKSKNGEKEYITDVPHFDLSIKFIPEFVVYKNAINELGILLEEEIKVIMYIYKKFKLIKRSCGAYKDKFNANKRSNKDIIEELEPINKNINYVSRFIKDIIQIYNLFFEDEREKKLKENLLKILDSLI